MGYQETYIKPVNQNDFNKLKECIEKLRNELNGAGVFPVEEIIFNANRKPFKKGDKAIYLVGERYYQTHIKQEFDVNVADFDVIFTEEVNPKGIWQDSTPNDKYIVTHQPLFID